MLTRRKYLLAVGGSAISCGTRHFRGNFDRSFTVSEQTNERGWRMSLHPVPAGKLVMPTGHLFATEPERLGRSGAAPLSGNSVAPGRYQITLPLYRVVPLLRADIQSRWPSLISRTTGTIGSPARRSPSGVNRRWSGGWQNRMATLL